MFDAVGKEGACKMTADEYCCTIEGAEKRANQEKKNVKIINS
jgi:hypothetical protein